MEIKEFCEVQDSCCDTLDEVYQFEVIHNLFDKQYISGSNLR